FDDLEVVLRLFAIRMVGVDGAAVKARQPVLAVRQGRGLKEERRKAGFATGGVNHLRLGVAGESPEGAVAAREPAGAPGAVRPAGEGLAVPVVGEVYELRLVVELTVDLDVLPTDHGKVDFVGLLARLAELAVGLGADDLRLDR